MKHLNCNCPFLKLPHTLLANMVNVSLNFILLHSSTIPISPSSSHFSSHNSQFLWTWKSVKKVVEISLDDEWKWRSVKTEINKLKTIKKRLRSPTKKKLNMEKDEKWPGNYICYRYMCAASGKNRVGRTLHFVTIDSSASLSTAQLEINLESRVYTRFHQIHPHWFSFHWRKAVFGGVSSYKFTSYVYIRYIYFWWQNSEAKYKTEFPHSIASHIRATLLKLNSNKGYAYSNLEHFMVTANPLSTLAGAIVWEGKDWPNCS